MNRIIGILIASSLMVSCATSQQQIDSHAPALDSWLGAPIAEFLILQGSPTVVIDRSDYQLYKFDALKTKRHVKWDKKCGPEPKYGEPKSCEDVITHSHVSTFKCSFEFVVVDSVINAWRMSGNYCRMVEVGQRAG